LFENKLFSCASRSIYCVSLSENSDFRYLIAGFVDECICHYKEGEDDSSPHVAKADNSESKTQICRTTNDFSKIKKLFYSYSDRMTISVRALGIRIA